MAAGWGRFFPSLYGFSILFGAFCYWQCRFYTFPPPHPHPPARNHSTGTARGTQENPFVWKSLICKFFIINTEVRSIFRR
jgi:hypothetical protein